MKYEYCIAWLTKEGKWEMMHDGGPIQKKIFKTQEEAEKAMEYRKKLLKSIQEALGGEYVHEDIVYAILKRPVGGWEGERMEYVDREEV